jgi:S1-C subfamily serine protease/predicted esterase
MQVASMRVLLTLLMVATPAAAQDLNERHEQAMKAAAAAVAPSVVKIETAGGTDVVGGPTVMAGGVRKGVGPTTGLVVSADGYVVSSSFNFANKPSDIFVTVPGRPGRLVAKQVATDITRMLTLLKVDATGLPVPAAFPKEEVRVGHWAIALGRTLPPEPTDPPSISVGIVSAVGRVMGKAIQTDAKVSPVNYGGPLVAADGRVIGVLVPASPHGDGDTAGVEWYDSGIGFAIPFADVLAVLPRLKQGKDLRRGLLGITAQSPDQYTAAVVIGSVAPDSAAAKAGLKTGDRIVTLDGKPVANYTQLQHVMGPKYEGDTLAVKVVRDGKEIEFKSVTLSGAVTATAVPLLGVMPLRDDPEPGVAVRAVIPKSAAEAAGIKAGDRILKAAPVVPGAPQQPDLAPVPGQGRAALAGMVSRLAPGRQIRLEVKRKDGGKTETLTATLGPVPDELPDGFVPPRPGSAGKALDSAKGGAAPKEKPKGPAKPEEKKDGDDEKKEPEVGLLQRKNATLGREYWVYVPENYTPNVSHGVIVWLHPAGKGGRDADDMVKIWRPFLEDFNYILVGPKAAAPEGWVASETEGVMQDVKEVLARYTVDRSRVDAHGMGVGGQMAFYLGFNARDVVRGVATTGAALATQPKDNLPAQPLSFFIVGGEKDPAVKEIARSKPALAEKKFPVIYRQLADFGKEYLDQKTLLELCVWMEMLDKI